MTEMWQSQPQNQSNEARGRDEIIGEGKLLGADLAHASEDVLQQKVQDLFERWECPGVVGGGTQKRGDFQEAAITSCTIPAVLSVFVQNWSTICLCYHAAGQNISALIPLVFWS